MRMDATKACVEARPSIQVDTALAATLADVLVGLTVQLSELAYDLGSDPETLRRHMGSLQAVDAITQSQLAIADILRSDKPVTDRFAAVTLEALASDLRRLYLERQVSLDTAKACYG